MFSMHNMPFGIGSCTCRTGHPFAVSGLEWLSQKIEFVFSASPEAIRRELQEGDGLLVVRKRETSPISPEAKSAPVIRPTSGAALSLPERPPPFTLLLSSLYGPADSERCRRFVVFALHRINPAAVVEAKHLVAEVKAREYDL